MAAGCLERGGAGRSRVCREPARESGEASVRAVPWAERDLTWSRLEVPLERRIYATLLSSVKTSKRRHGLTGRPRTRPHTPCASRRGACTCRFNHGPSVARSAVPGRCKVYSFNKHTRTTLFLPPPRLTSADQQAQDHLCHFLCLRALPRHSPPPRLFVLSSYHPGHLPHHLF